MKNRVSRFHKRSQTHVYSDQSHLAFRKLLVKNETVSVHQNNSQILEVEIYKAKYNVSPGLVCEIFQFMEKMEDRRTKSTLRRRKYIKPYFGNWTLLGPKILALGPES